MSTYVCELSHDIYEENLFPPNSPLPPFNQKHGEIYLNINDLYGEAQFSFAFVIRGCALLLVYQAYVGTKVWKFYFFTIGSNEWG